MNLCFLTLAAIPLGFLIDALLGDPVWILPHPVVLIGHLIACCERFLRKQFPKTPRGERTAGALMAVFVPLVSASASFGILAFCFWIHPALYFAVCILMCWQILAARCLQKEASKVVRALRQEGLPAARAQLSMLVGRDTGQLTETQAFRATVETVAENTSDGVIAPLFWMMLGGPVGGFFYKAVNTMDSMVGYKNERYLHFGRFAAKLDDIVNFLPARLSAIGMIAVSAFLGFDVRKAAYIWKRDRRKHASPNSAQTEAACAGALHIQLGGPASYFGKLHDKPFLGDPDREIEPEDVVRSCRLMYAASILWLAVFEAVALSILTVLLP